MTPYPSSLLRRWTIRLILFFFPWIAVTLLLLFFQNQFKPVTVIRDAYRVTRAALLEMFRDYDAALHALNELKSVPVVYIKTTKWRRELLQRNAMKQFNMGYFNRAVQLFDRLVESGKAGYFVWLYRGICHWKTGHPEKAIDSFRKAISKAPYNHDAYLACGHVFLLTGNRLDAIPYYLKAMEKAPGLGALYADCGDAFRRTGDPATAETFYQKGHAVDPADPYCIIRIAEYRFHVLKQREAAIGTLKKLSRRYPDWKVVQNLRNVFMKEEPTDGLSPVFIRFGGIGHIRNSEIPDSKILFDLMRDDWQGNDVDAEN